MYRIMCFAFGLWFIAACTPLRALADARSASDSYAPHATAITLIVQHMPARKAFESVCQQAGVEPVVFYRYGRNGVRSILSGPLGNLTVTTRLVRVPFWTAMHTMFEQTGYSPGGHQSYGGIRLRKYGMMSRPPRGYLSELSTILPRWHFGRCFAVSPANVGFEKIGGARVGGPKQESCQIALNVLTDPSVHVLLLDKARVKITSFQDRPGHSLLVPRGTTAGNWGSRHQEGGPISQTNSAFMFEIFRTIRCRIPQGKRIALLAGYADLSVGVPEHCLLPSNSLRAKTLIPDLHIAIDKFGIQNGNWNVRLHLHVAPQRGPRTRAVQYLEMLGAPGDTGVAEVTAIGRNGKKIGTFPMHSFGSWYDQSAYVLLEGCQTKPRALLVTYYPHSAIVKVPFRFTNVQPYRH